MLIFFPFLYCCVVSCLQYFSVIMPTKNEWIWAKWPLWINWTEDKIAPIEKYNSSLFFFFSPFLYCCFVSCLQYYQLMRYTKQFYSLSEKNSKKRRRCKARIKGAKDLASAPYWLRQISLAARPIRSTTQDLFRGTSSIGNFLHSFLRRHFAE